SAPGPPANATPRAPATAGRALPTTTTTTTIQLPANFHIPPGTVLIRSNNGQLMLVTQQALTRAETPSPVNGRPAAATGTAPVRLCAVQNSGSQLIKKVAAPIRTVSPLGSAETPPVQKPSAVQPVATPKSIVSVTPVTPLSTVAPLKSSAPGMPPAPSALPSANALKADVPGAAPTDFSTEMLENVKKCKNFLAMLIKLACSGVQSPEMGQNVKNLVQNLLEAKIEPEEFTKELYIELKSSPQPHLAPFLKKSMMALRQLMPNCQGFIQECAQQPTHLAVSTSAQTVVSPTPPVTLAVTPRQSEKTAVISGVDPCGPASLQAARPGAASQGTVAVPASLQPVRPGVTTVMAPSLQPGKPAVSSGAAPSTTGSLQPGRAAVVSGPGAPPATRPLQPVRATVVSGTATPPVTVSLQPLKPVAAPGTVTPATLALQPVRHIGTSGMATPMTLSLQTLRPVVASGPGSSPVTVVKPVVASGTATPPVTVSLPPVKPVVASGMATPPVTISLPPVKPIVASGAATPPVTVSLQPVKPLVASGTASSPGTASVPPVKSMVASGTAVPPVTVALQPVKPMAAPGTVTPPITVSLQSVKPVAASGMTASPLTVPLQPTKPVVTSGMAPPTAVSLQPVRPVATTPLTTVSLQTVRPMVASGTAASPATVSLQPVKPAVAPGTAAAPTTVSFQPVKLGTAPQVATTDPSKPVLGAPIRIRLAQPNCLLAQPAATPQTVKVKQLVVHPPAAGSVKPVVTAPNSSVLTVQKSGQKRVPLNTLIQANQFPAASILKQITLPGNKVLSLHASSVPKNKIKENGTASFSYEDDINDVTSMAGVNLSEENACILATNAKLVGTLVRSCKEEPFLLPAVLQRRILDTGRRHDITELSSEVVNLISLATQERLRGLLEKLTVIAQHRMTSYKESEKYTLSNDTRSQLRFLEKLDHLEKQRKDEEEREMLFRAAKSRSNKEDPEQLRLKQKAKEFQQMALAQMQQRDANITALAAIGPRKKRPLGSSVGPGSECSNGTAFGSGLSSGTVVKHLLRPRVTRVCLRDLIFCMEQEKETKHSLALYQAFLK
ncbi:transcription initiation factor TFIID subunit 4B, partial [Tachyglossus aculeatus]|uniref:transcription initiation factor TFIID subunit 4B n=1 Tax=Tachyglossus aculeatus TaxID=9261 RepID=UPI0018F760CD